MRQRRRLQAGCSRPLPLLAHHLQYFLKRCEPFACASVLDCRRRRMQELALSQECTCQRDPPSVIGPPSRTIAIQFKPGDRAIFAGFSQAVPVPFCLGLIEALRRIFRDEFFESRRFLQGGVRRRRFWSLVIFGRAVLLLRLWWLGFFPATTVYERRRRRICSFNSSFCSFFLI